jgi:hypothetical protein
MNLKTSASVQELQAALHAEAPLDVVAAFLAALSLIISF